MSGLEKFLVIDSAMNGCNVAYYDAGRGVCHADVFEGARGQAEQLVPMMQNVLSAGGASFEDVQAIVVVNGPGTFTGIRIGLSAVRALRLSLDVPLYGVTTLQALALCYVAGGNQKYDGFTVVVETRRADFYVQDFGFDAAAKGDARSVFAEDVEAQTFIGDAAQRFEEQGGRGVRVDGFERIDPCVLAAAFCHEEQRRQFFNEDPAPLYLRAPDVSMPKTPPRRLAQ